MSHAKPAPLGGTLMTPSYMLILALAVLGAVVMVWRFLHGLGDSANMNDGYPWGLWIAFDVVTGTALGAGGYAMALLIYILNGNQYHPLIRPAMVTTALGYSIAGLSIVLDLGRWWNVWRIPISFSQWNLNSALLEVALCVMLYTVVAWLEVGDSILEHWSGLTRTWPQVASLSKALHGPLRAALPFVIALGVLLPTMHQSSLGTLMVLTAKLHPLWHTSMLPLLFLVSCVSMGYGGVVLESSIASRAFRTESESELLGRVSKVMAYLVLGYLVLRVGDVVVRGALSGASGGYVSLFVLEQVLFLVPALLLLSEERRRNPGVLFGAAAMLVSAGAFYRFNVYLVAFNPGSNWSYFPSINEILISVGLVSIELAVYIFIVKRFPILSGRAGMKSAPAL
jgi:Ni/Fe-hydrogenase subunit HybB-like protein